MRQATLRQPVNRSLMATQNRGSLPLEAVYLWCVSGDVLGHFGRFGYTVGIRMYGLFGKSWLTPPAGCQS